MAIFVRLATCNFSFGFFEARISPGLIVDDDVALRGRRAGDAKRSAARLCIVHRSFIKTSLVQIIRGEDEFNREFSAAITVEINPPAAA